MISSNLRRPFQVPTINGFIVCVSKIQHMRCIYEVDYNGRSDVIREQLFLLSYSTRNYDAERDLLAIAKCLVVT